MEEETSHNFKFINFGSELEINIDENIQAQCPNCKKIIKQLVHYLKKMNMCRSNIDLDHFKIEYQSFCERRKQRQISQRKLDINAEETHRKEAEKTREIKQRKLDTNSEV